MKKLGIFFLILGAIVAILIWLASRAEEEEE
jgi:hypothetical protein